MNIAAISPCSMRNNMYNRPAFKSSNYDKFDRSEWANNICPVQFDEIDVADKKPVVKKAKIVVERSPYYEDRPASPLGFGYIVIDNCDLDTETGELCRRK